MMEKFEEFLEDLKDKIMGWIIMYLLGIITGFYLFYKIIEAKL